MIGGLFFLASIIAIFIVLIWFTRQDGSDGTGGFLAMRPPDAEPPRAKPKRWSREDALRR
ncbi:hypothetical protein FHS83_000046 [Rhizomicrobium palustre]|uniref:Uncharacterized protein n=1 Tax=Rhizomicrobium palustre TaxID=189966 RepID=A0A846MTA1_9PROT|nr:hypothetical protein [Rhizomicrobium palustre]NIK86728.1 hypothetical protein [Rhizomicrobium palustre]